MKLLLENLRDKWMQLQLRERQLIILGSGLLIYRYLCGFVTDNGET